MIRDHVSLVPGQKDEEPVLGLMDQTGSSTDSLDYLRRPSFWISAT